MSRPSKQQRIDTGKDKDAARLQSVLGIGTTSDASVGAILSTIDGKGPTRRNLTEARQAKYESLHQVINLPLQDGGSFKWELCHPGLPLTRIVSESAALQAAFKSALQRHPCSSDQPWRLLVAFDEHIPGNKLNLQPARKSMNLCFSFEELGGACV